MPDINDLLRGAAPDPAPYDEDSIRRRVARRRRTRRVVVGLGALLVLVTGAIVVVATTGDDEQPVLADKPTTTTTGGRFAAVPASIAIVGDQIWMGGDGFVSRGDGTDRIDVPGNVVSLAVGDVLWVRGDTWVVAVDTAAKKVVGSWHGGTVGDIVALPSQEVAISLPDTDEVAIAKTSAIAELEEVWRIPVRTKPGDLVRTTGGDVWVTCGDGITELDVGAQGVKRVEDWRGPLLAPSLSGGIWTVEGDRVIDLHPENLGSGLSVAEGARYVVDATMAVETSFGLYTGGPKGVLRFSPQTPNGEVVTKDVPDALDAAGGQVTYITGGEVHTASAHGDQTADPQAWQHEPRQVAARYLSDELHWPDVIIDHDENASASTDGTDKVVYATSAGLTRDAKVSVHLSAGVWSVSGLWTFGSDDHPASVSLGNGNDHVGFDYRDPALGPALTVRYGDSHTTMKREVGAAAVWDGDLGFVADTPGLVQVLFLNADGVALEGWATSLPRGPFAAG
jgi:hypothetical protein